MRRVTGQPPPWTEDPVLQTYKFTNVYRASDRTSQYLIRHVLYEGPQGAEEIVFRTLLFKFFNRISTWEALTAQVGPLTWQTFEAERYAGVLDALESPIYSGAYNSGQPPGDRTKPKHRRHLQLIENMMRYGAPREIARARSLQKVYEILLRYPSMGDFLAYQFAIDLNYSELINFDEMDFVVAGPGATDGIHKCFVHTAGLTEADVIRATAEHADREFAQRGLRFQTLWGRPLQLIDCQNLFCEVDKYARVVHPGIEGRRTKIKQKFVPNSASIPQWYPPKWGLSVPVSVAAAPRHVQRVALRRRGV
jgi:hypothetical protein